MRGLIELLAPFFLVRLLRVVGFLARFRERRPLGCNVCMAWWASLPVGLAIWPVGLGRLVACVGLAGLTLVLLELAETFRPPPIDPSDLP